MKSIMHMAMLCALALSTVIGFGSKAHAATWVPVFQSYSGAETASIDTESISFQGDIAECRVHFAYQEPQKLETGNDYSTIKMMIAIDGARKLWTAKYGIYSTGQGAVVDSESYPDATPSDMIVPDSMMDHVFRFLLGYAANNGN